MNCNAKIDKPTNSSNPDKRKNRPTSSRFHNRMSSSKDFGISTCVSVSSPSKAIPFVIICDCDIFCIGNNSSAVVFLLMAYISILAYSILQFSRININNLTSTLNYNSPI